MGVALGGGYWFVLGNPARPGMDVAVGFDLTVVPTPLFSGDQSFALGVNVVLGLRLYFSLGD